MQALLVFVVGLLLGAGQLVFKYVGNLAAQSESKNFLVTLALMPQFYGAVALYGLATLLYIWVLSKEQLVLSYLIIVAVSFLVTVVGAQLFGEKITIKLIIAAVLIIAGIVVARSGA